LSARHSVFGFIQGGTLDFKRKRISKGEKRPARGFSGKISGFESFQDLGHLDAGTTVDKIVISRFWEVGRPVIWQSGISENELE